MTPVFRESYPAPPLDEREVLRYAGCREADGEMLALLRDCRALAEPLLTYRLCYCELPCSVTGETCALGGLRVRSASLASHLSGCHAAIAFAATVGLPLDRLIAREGRLSPARGVMLQALGAERIEALCDAFEEDTRARMRETGLLCRRRFSPGYGDLPLSFQADLFSLLACEKAIGLTLTGSGMMVPTKSVTALIGVATQETL
jgi:hypothetical protein